MGFRFFPSAVSNVSVNLGSLGAGTPEKFVDAPKVGVLFEGVGGEGVSEGVDGFGWVDCGSNFGVGGDMPDASDAVWAAVRAFEEILDGLIYLGVFLRDVLKVWRKECATVFSAFSVSDEESVLLGLQVGESGVCSFADAESGGVDEHEDASEFKVMDGIKGCCDFVGLECLQEPFGCLGQLECFGFEGLPCGSGVEEFKGADELDLVCRAIVMFWDVVYDVVFDLLDSALRGFEVVVIQ